MLKCEKTEFKKGRSKRCISALLILLIALSALGCSDNDNSSVQTRTMPNTTENLTKRHTDYGFTDFECKLYPSSGHRQFIPQMLEEVLGKYYPAQQTEQ